MIMAQDDERRGLRPGGMLSTDVMLAPGKLRAPPQAAGGGPAGDDAVPGAPACRSVGQAARPGTANAAVRQRGHRDRDTDFFALAEMARMPMVLTDPNLPGNPTVFANEAFRDMTGYDQAEVVGRDWSFLQGAQTDRGTAAQLHAAVVERRTAAADLLIYRRDGMPLWDAVHLAPVYDGAGNLIYFFSSHLDVTGRRASEQASRQARTTAAIGRLTAGLAHDFNNLLQVVSGNLELLKPKLADARLHRYLDDAGTAADRLAALTAQLLTCGQRTRLEPEAVDLNALVTGLGYRLVDVAGTGIHLRFDLSARLPPARVDPAHLEKALLSVVANARQAMPGGGRLTVATASSSGGGAAPLPHGDYVVLSVADEGQGMSADVLERATEPFFTTRPVGQGSGLGLATAHGFVAQSLGRLDIASQPGRGTTIRMVLPAVSGGTGAPLPRDGSAPRNVRGADATSG